MIHSAPSCSCRCKSGIGPLSDQITLEFSQRAHQMKDQLSSRDGRINLFREADEPDIALLEAPEQINQMG
jgi:hypothetical protein